jgi:hypothetical protein
MELDKVDSLFRIIERYDHYIELANNKANYVLASIVTINIAMAALLGYSDVFRFEVASPLLGIFKILSLVCYCLFLFFSLVALKGVNKIIFPNTNSPDSGELSNIYFGDVSSRTYIEYAEVVETLMYDVFLKDLAFQVNTLAAILNEKFIQQKNVMEVTVKQVIPSVLVTSVLCGLIKSFS